MKHGLKKIFYLLLMIITTLYIIFRIAYTLPTKLGFISMFLAMIVLLLEIWETFDFFIYFINILMVNKKKIEVPSINGITEFPDVDVFIATYNESADLLANTITACKAMEYPDKSKVHIYLCDDGNRKEIKNLAKDLGINYFSRDNNRNAKAGNYNNALNRTTSPYIATFDADMAPTPDFLYKTIPFFMQKEKIGFVQLPQSFLNPDIFQYRFGLENKIPFEQDYFYHDLQIAKNNTNSVVYCGTNTVISRQALLDVNGFAKDCISEDIATGMLIEAKGYKCIALPEVAAYGNAVNELSGFLKQRSRWGRGCVQMSKKYKIFGCKGLSLRQKLEYYSCVSYWFFGLRRMLYLTIPLLFSLFGIIIVDCNPLLFLGLWAPPFILKRFVLDRMEGRRRSATWNNIYETILAPVLSKEIVKEHLGFTKTKFDITPKGSASTKMSKENKKLLTSHSLLLIANLLGFILCLIRINTNTVPNYILSLVWTLSNVFYLTIAVIFDLRVNPSKFKGFVPNKIKRFSRKTVLLIFFNKKEKSAIKG